MLKLQSGFCFDYSNAYGGKGKITATDMENLQAQLVAAHMAVDKIRKTGVAQWHLSKDGTPEPVLFNQLPYVKLGNINTPASINKLIAYGDSLKNRVQSVVSFGIGGSYLGNKVIFDVNGGEFWNSNERKRQGRPKLYFSGNNLDPASVQGLIAELINQARNWKKTHNTRYAVSLIIISKSGSTLEPMACFMSVLEALYDHADLIEVEVVAVTDPASGAKETALHRLASQQGWTTFSVPDGVGGRFSVFCDVGLITAAVLGFDVRAFLQGAKDMDLACQTDDVWGNPALLNVALKYIASEKYGKNIEVFMPYANSLKSLAEWYIQLLAESLGKRLDKNSAIVNYGRTPIVAVGTTDMHAQTQQHQEGKKDKFIQFVEVDSWVEDFAIPNLFPTDKVFSNMSNIKMSAALNAALAANAEALAGDNRFSAVFKLPQLDAYHLGELMYLLALSIAYEGELANVDAFDQPGVEGYKKILLPKLKDLQ